MKILVYDSFDDWAGGHQIEVEVEKGEEDAEQVSSEEE